MPLRNKIFIGSSTEALKVAEMVGEMIRSHKDTEAVLWNTRFPAGQMLLEEIERLPQEITGAVLLATPDIEYTRDGEPFTAPIANVVFEYGYLAARLTRKRVAICRFGKLDLPSDVEGVNVIVIRRDEYEYRKGVASPLPDNAKTKISQWLDELPPLVEGMPAVSQVHGYSGTWNVQNHFTRWRGRDIDKDKGDEVYFDGKTLLVLQDDGTRGTGVQVGKLYASVGQYRVTREVVNEILWAKIDKSGTLTLRVKLIRSRAVPGTEQGADPPLQRDLTNREFELELNPSAGEVKMLRGPHGYKKAAEVFQSAEENFEYFGLFDAPGLEA